MYLLFEISFVIGESARFEPKTKKNDHALLSLTIARCIYKCKVWPYPVVCYGNR